MLADALVPLTAWVQAVRRHGGLEQLAAGQAGVRGGRLEALDDVLENAPVLETRLRPCQVRNGVSALRQR